MLIQGFLILIDSSILKCKTYKKRKLYIYVLLFMIYLDSIYTNINKQLKSNQNNSWILVI